jgi:hypothetical protein
VGGVGARASFAGRFLYVRGDGGARGASLPGEATHGASSGASEHRSSVAAAERAPARLDREPGDGERARPCAPRDAGGAARSVVRAGARSRRPRAMATVARLGDRRRRERHERAPLRRLDRAFRDRAVPKARRAVLREAARDLSVRVPPRPAAVRRAADRVPSREAAPAILWSGVRRLHLLGRRESAPAPEGRRSEWPEALRVREYPR